MKFVWPPLLTAIETRQKDIADGLAQAERGRHELELASKRATEILHEAKQKSAEIIAASEQRAAQVIEEAKSAAKVEGDRVLARRAARPPQQRRRFNARSFSVSRSAGRRTVPR